LVHIHFETKQQASRMMDVFAGQIKKKYFFQYIKYDNGNSIAIALNEQNSAILLQMLRDAFLVFIKGELFPQWLMKIVREKFHYSEQDECEQIVEIATAIMSDEKMNNEPFWNELQLKIHYGLVSIFERNVSFSFPSFLTFRMRGIMDHLLRIVVEAIDEYKMEQEYQSFIHTLRKYMLSVSPKMMTLHLLHLNSFTFYDDAFLEMKREDIVKFIDRKLFTDYPMYIDSNVLAPLISIAPMQVYIYCDEESNLLIQTIQRIFEERVKVFPMKMFTTPILKSH